ncbi:MAG: glycosyltransferase family 1 protein [Pedobacter sp.]|nr:MAG: glycosyltransferase family 1 protein [Pedobacter sp.]
MQEWKGPDILCKALSLLTNSDVMINWYGRDTNYDGKITKGEQLKQKYPNIWGQKIIPNSPVLNSQLVRIQREANFAIIPSTWDMFNFTGLEYMSVGTPVICADGAGFSELIIDGVNGFKYSKNDYTSLANCIEKVTNLSIIDYNSIVERAKQTFATTLECSKLIRENFNVYENAIANFMPNKKNAFIEALYFPDNLPNKIDDILDKQPLKTLLTYTLKRLMQKFNSKWVP